MTAKLPGTPWTKVMLSAEMMLGGETTVRVKDCVVSDGRPFVAVMVMGKFPDRVGVPESTPLLLKETPLGKVPVSLKLGSGVPAPVTVNVPA